ncbi:hypothetical protein SM007_38220 [Streptomyces avermitilis]|uniref:hypothetical protein n=1 Tax=Streptomyces avermitilis TaxID=33903 RepID=UPI00099457EF|nr:hypothetical protein [Streptomyces avermitilis]OOV16677.1 hypothetical protein SM007_38220 [Streptomyces avermitilis]
MLHDFWTMTEKCRRSLKAADTAIRQARKEIDWLGVLPAHGCGPGSRGARGEQGRREHREQQRGDVRPDPRQCRHRLALPPFDHDRRLGSALGIRRRRTCATPWPARPRQGTGCAERRSVIR